MGARNYKPSKSEKKIYKAIPAQASSFQSEEQQIKCKKFCGEKRGKLNEQGTDVKAGIKVSVKIWKI